MRRSLLPLAMLVLASPSRGDEIDFTSLRRDGSAPGAAIVKAKAELSSLKWSFLRTAAKHDGVKVELTATIRAAATAFGYFGEFWSVWPDPTFADQGFEVGVVLREGKDCGYRVQLSHKYQAAALVRYPDGGYVRVVPCEVKLGVPHRLSIAAQGNEVVVAVDGAEKIRFVDDLPDLPAGPVGVGTSSNAKVTLEKLVVSALPPAARRAAPAHFVRLSSRKWLGGRQWIFDGDEPILLLPTPGTASINAVKLRPGHKPQLSWNAEWDIANQGAYKEGSSRMRPVKVAGGGKTIRADWVSRQVEDRFETRTRMDVGYDPRRKVYTYDISSEMEVLPGKPFEFRYGYDFEHHTPLDPFRWQYLVARRRGGAPYHRPVYPIDPGPQYDLETKNGLRLWFGRHGEAMTICPAVEYRVADTGGRRLNTAVCAAFYDTGVSFSAETAPAGTKVRVAYRYTGYPKAEAEHVFASSTVYESPMLDPDHHYVFADDWPRLRFDKAVPMSETWVYGRRPFMTAHNSRPRYEWVKLGKGDFAMRLGPGSFGAATLATPADLPAGRYVLLADVKTDNPRGPGGRIELTVAAPKTAKELGKHVHYPGAARDWKTVGFAFDVPVAGAGLTLGLGNAGTGEMLVRAVEFRKLEAGEKPPAGVEARANGKPARSDPPPAGAIADYRMEEGKGLHVYNHAHGPLGLLELGNVGWTRDGGRAALVFAGDPDRRPAFPRAGSLDLNYLATPGYKGRDRVPVALTGSHGGSIGELKAFTLAAWIKPAGRMGKSEHHTGGDVIGFGARRFILRLRGDKAPYSLELALNVNDRFTAKPSVEAGRWQHVAVTGEPAGKKWRVRLYLDGKQVLEGTTEKATNPMSPPPSLILGAEIFYFHDSFYRGLIGRTLILDRAVGAEELATIMK